MKFAVTFGVFLSIFVVATPASAVVFSGPDFTAFKSEDAAFTWSYDTEPSSQTCSLTGPSGSSTTDCAILAGYSANALQRGLTLAPHLSGDGTYTLTVDAPSTTPNPATHHLIVDDTPPILTLSGPTGLTNNKVPSITVSTTDGTIRCALDPSGTTPAEISFWPICGSGPLAPVGDGSHILRAAAVDSVGNISPVQSLSFTVDTVPPAIDLQGISNGSVVPTPYPQYSLGSPDAVSLQCFYDNNPAITCASISVSTVGLGDGAHTMHVIAVDLAGNTSTLVVSFTVNDSLPEGPIPTSVSLKTGKIKNAGSRIKVALAGSFTVSGNVNWATACTGRATIAMTGKVGRKTRTFRANAKLKRKRSSCTFNTTLTAPKAWKGKRQKTTITYEGNSQLGSFSVTGKLRLRQAR